MYNFCCIVYFVFHFQDVTPFIQLKKYLMFVFTISYMEIQFPYSSSITQERNQGNGKTLSSIRRTWEDRLINNLDGLSWSLSKLVGVF